MHKIGRETEARMMIKEGYQWHSGAMHEIIKDHHKPLPAGVKIECLASRTELAGQHFWDLNKDIWEGEDEIKAFSKEALLRLDPTLSERPIKSRWP